MKQFSVTALVLFVRVCITAFILALLSLLLFSFTTTIKVGDDVWKQLGLNKQQGTEGIYRSFTGGYLYYYEARNAKQLLLGNRLAVAKDLLLYTKQYINSDQFKKEYELERKNAMPEKPVPAPLRTREQVQKDEIAKAEKSMKDLEKAMKEMDAGMRKNMEPMLEMFRTHLKEYQNPGHQYFSSLLLMEKSNNEQDQRNYESRLEKWKKQYPVNFSHIIKERLKKFLEITKDVDFDAELKTINHKKIFVNPDYERKSTEWKQAFRAGKEITTMARTFAAQWLNEIS